MAVLDAKQGHAAGVPAAASSRSLPTAAPSLLPGISRPMLQLAWDFTTASTRQITNRMLSMRDDALKRTAGDIKYDIIKSQVRVAGRRRLCACAGA